MDRKKFLQICQKVSILKDGVSGIKINVPDDLKVIYNDIIYYPVAYELSFEEGNAIHKAILHDLKTNCIRYANLDRVDKFDNK